MKTVDYSYKYQILLPEAGQKIEMLYLDHNRLTTVPEALQFPCLWSSLKVLLLHSNKLTRLPAEIGSLKSLSVLHLYDNLLTSLPEELSRLINIQVLYLNDNLLESLPSSISNLTRLQKFTLHRNNLRVLPATMLPLIDYLQVSLDGNPLMEPPDPIPATDYFFAGESPDRVPSLLTWCRRFFSIYEKEEMYNLQGIPEDLVEYLAEEKLVCEKCSVRFYRADGPSVVLFGKMNELYVPFQFIFCSVTCAGDTISSWLPPKLPDTPTLRIRSQSL